MNYIQILYLCILKQPTPPYHLPMRCCELHSNLVSLHSETTEKFESGGIVGLWITFKSCIFAFWNNMRKIFLLAVKGCELHSNLVSLHSETTLKAILKKIQELWITFKSCIFAFWNNLDNIFSISLFVVNYIQILYLCILKQLELLTADFNVGCELHSNLVSLHSETTVHLIFRIRNGLWITFKSCIFAFWNNDACHLPGYRSVVNYIQILYLCILKQLLCSNPL